MRKALGLMALLILTVVMPAAPAFAQQYSFGAPAANKFQFPASVEARVAPPVALAGETVTVEVTLDINAGHHIYAMKLDGPGPTPTVLKFKETGGLEEIDGEDWIEPEPKSKYDMGFEMMVGTHEGKVTFRRAMRVPTGAAAGEVALSGSIRIQVCDESSCLPPRELPWSSKVLLRGDGPGGETPPTPTPEATPAPTETPTAQKAETATGATIAADTTKGPGGPKGPAPASFGTTQEESLGLFMAAAFLAGLATLLTPCVFPMIPITISFFTKRATESAGRRIALASTYGGSIVVGFALVGLLLSLGKLALGWGVDRSGAVNQIAASPSLNAAMALLFFAFALSLFGAFDIALPSSWANALQRKGGGRADMMGAVLMAGVFVLVSFTCTAPFVGALIPQALSGHWLRPFAGLALYGLGFGLPFFVLGLVPGLIAALPKAGGWMNATKVTMGMLELGLAFKFVSNVDLVLGWGIFTREVLLAIFAIVLVGCTLYLLGIVRMDKDPEPKGIGTPRLLFGLMFGALSLYAAQGLFGGRLHADLEAFMPPDKATFSGSASSGGGASGSDGGAHGGLDFIRNDLDAAVARAIEQDKRVFIDFTGWTCTNCRLMEKNMFPRPAVQELMGDFVRVALYTDDAEVGEKYQKFQIEQFGVATLPFYAIVDPAEQRTLATFAGLTRDESAFVRFLEAGSE